MFLGHDASVESEKTLGGGLASMTAFLACLHKTYGTFYAGEREKASIPELLRNLPEAANEREREKRGLPFFALYDGVGTPPNPSQSYGTFESARVYVCRYAYHHDDKSP